VTQTGPLGLRPQRPFWRGGQCKSRIRVTLQDTLAFPPRTRHQIAHSGKRPGYMAVRDLHQLRKEATFALVERLPICIGCFSGIWQFSSFLRPEREAGGDSARQVRGTSIRKVRARPRPTSPYNDRWPERPPSGHDTTAAARSAIHREQVFCFSRSLKNPMVHLV
jgi:hypothetical protein